ncbi:hypothetical protein J6590_096716 [Homalodisca vitripennis]|nr:hypothetical protein J6590_096716 [Homalodisca vitripennis]
MMAIYNQMVVLSKLLGTKQPPPPASPPPPAVAPPRSDPPSSTPTLSLGEPNIVEEEGEESGRTSPTPSTLSNTSNAPSSCVIS